MQEAKPHLLHLDVLKGVAIIMVVMGHVCIHCMPDFRTPFVNIICSVHMPLFIVISGFLSARAVKFDKASVAKYWRGKVTQLLLPLLILPALYTWFLRQPVADLFYGTYHNGYWFTFVLFEIFVLNYLFRFISKNFTERTRLIGEILVSIIVIALTFFLSTVVAQWYPQLYTSMSLEQLVWLLPYFLLGYIIGAYRWIEELFSNKYVVVLAVLVYIILMYVEYHGYKPIRGIPATLSGLCAMYTMAKALTKEQSWITRSLAYLGKESLPIYLIHYFFLFSIPMVSVFFESMPADARTFSLELLIILLASAWVLTLTLVVIRLIKSSDVLAFILFGQNINNR